MDYFEKLNDFADGTLDIEKEDDFYMRLSTDDELKSNLKNLLLMKSTLSRNENYFNPPSKATIGIFSTLGIALPSNLIEPVPVNKSSKIANFFKVNRKSILTGIISSLATLIIVYLLISLISGNGNSNTQISKSSPINIKSTPFIQNFENTDIYQNKPVEKSKSIPDKPIIKYIYIHDKKSDISNDNINPSGTISNNQNLMPVTQSKPWLSENSILINPRINEPWSISEKNRNKFGFSFKPNNDLFIELRNMIVYNIPQPTISPNRYSEFNNLSLTVLYSITDNGKFGLECRQETFYQKYKGVDYQGVNNIYEQQPNFTTVSLAYRYNFLNQNQYSLFGQVQLGGNVVGYVGRLMAGASYNAYDDLIFLAGIEYSNLYYRYQKQGFSSSKLGFNYGINYKF